MQGGAPRLPNWGTLEHVLMKRLEQVQMTKEEIWYARRCLSEIQRMASLVDPSWEVRPFGSLYNGFAMRGTDLDATCCRSVDNYWVSAIDMQTQLLPLIEAHAQFRVVEVIPGARVPIIKARFDTHLDVDISFQNKESLANTHYLRAYAALSPRVRDVVMLVKLWAKAAGVCGAVDGHLSAYSFTLMVIYFMQVDPLVRMPPIPPMMFTGESSDPPRVQIEWSCDLPRVYLLHRFFRFFSDPSEFQWGTEVVSTRRACRAARDDPDYAMLRGRHEPRLHIEDPFLRDRNLHCVLRPTQEAVLMSKLVEAAEEMQCGLLPVGLQAVYHPSPQLRPQHAVPTPPVAIHVGSHGSANKMQKEGTEMGPHVDVSEGSASAATKRGPQNGQEAYYYFVGPNPSDIPITLLQRTFRL